MPTERMPNPATLIPEATRALAALDAALRSTALDERLLTLTHLRASQINGCGPGVSVGARRLRAEGGTVEVVDAVAAWRHTPWFSDAERAALALTESVTRLADDSDPVPDQVWDAAAKHFDHHELAGLLLNIAVTNAFNRLSVSTRQQTDR